MIDSKTESGVASQNTTLDPAASDSTVSTTAGGMRRRWRFVVLVGGALAGLAAIGQATDIANKTLVIVDKIFDRIYPYCDGRPINELRAAMWGNINAVGGFYSAAREQANQLLGCIKNDHDALNALGAIEFYSTNYAQAEEYFRRGIKSKADSRALHLNFADTLVELGRYEAALSEYKAFDNGSVILAYRIARAHLFSANYSEARSILTTVSSEFAEQAKPGKARILEAAALVGLAQRESGPARDVLLSTARASFVEGINKDRLWWIELLTGRSTNRHEPFTRVAAILGDKISPWIEGDTR